MFDWDKMEERQARVVASARCSQPGMGREHLTPDALVTVSPCLCTGDRSFVDTIWRVVARNDGHVVLRAHDEASQSSWMKGPRIIAIHEREFYPAEHLVAAVEQKPLEASGTASE